MYAKRNYGFWMTLNWSKKPFLYGMVYATMVHLLHDLAEHMLSIDVSLPWQPISVMGIAVAFYLGFKNNSSYDRTWEARKIWGAIVNNSRTFGAAVISFVHGPNEEEVRKRLIYRHIAWLTALRHQLRLSRPWEHIEDRVHGLYFPTVCEKYTKKLDHELEAFISAEEIQRVNGKTNMATQIMALQAEDLSKLCKEGYFEDFRHMEFHQLVAAFYDEQGKSERIKNFPFPRQYASIALWTTYIFSALIPFGMLNVLTAAEDYASWLSIPLTALLIWVFFLMEKVGDYSENPFEGSYNDVPITTISRAIEIDLREMINDKDIPKPIPDSNGFQM
jgi:ion channel-forming bestrophin family protein